MINGIGSSTAARLAGLGGGAPAPGGVARGKAANDTAAASTAIGRLAAEGPPVDTDRVAALRAAIRAGSYKADPASIADRMVDGDL